jgi:hypothetical protein
VILPLNQPENQPATWALRIGEGQVARPACPIGVVCETTARGPTIIATTAMMIRRSEDIQRHSQMGATLSFDRQNELE